MQFSKVILNKEQFLDVIEMCERLTDLSNANLNKAIWVLNSPDFCFMNELLDSKTLTQEEIDLYITKKQQLLNSLNELGVLKKEIVEKLNQQINDLSNLKVRMALKEQVLRSQIELELQNQKELKLLERAKDLATTLSQAEKLDRASIMDGPIMKHAIEDACQQYIDKLYAYRKENNLEHLSLLEVDKMLDKQKLLHLNTST